MNLSHILTDGQSSFRSLYGESVTEEQSGHLRIVKSFLDIFDLVNLGIIRRRPLGEGSLRGHTRTFGKQEVQNRHCPRE